MRRLSGATRLSYLSPTERACKAIFRPTEYMMPTPYKSCKREYKTKVLINRLRS